MAHYNIFREQLATKYPAFGHALWDPEPRNPDRPTQVGDVGFIRTGKFHRLFNALLPADDPSQEFGVPEYYEPLSPSLLKHVDKGTRSPSNYCSAGVCVEDIPAHYSNSPYESDFRRTSFRYSRTRGAAVLSLPVTTQREDTLAQGGFGRWVVRHIGSWLAFAQKLELGIVYMEEIILVTGRDLTRSWTNVAFLGGEVDAQVSFGVDVHEDSDLGTNIRFQPALSRGALIAHGPEGKNLPENQCVFLRGFRVARSFWGLPKHLKAAAGSSPDPGDGSDCDPNTELVSTPNIKYRDPLSLIQDYIVEQVPDCDMVLIHDNDLVMIDGIGCRGTSPETLESDVVMDHLWTSNIQVHEVMCELSPTDSPSSRNADMTTVKIAMLPKTFQNWNAASPSQWPPVAQNIDIGYTSELRDIPPQVVSDSSQNWEGPPNEEARKRDEQAKNVHSDEQALFEHVTTFIDENPESAEAASNALDAILRTYPSAPEMDDATIPSSFSFGGLPPTSPPHPMGHDPFLDYIDYSAFDVPTPELVAGSSTNSSPESASDQDHPHTGRAGPSPQISNAKPDDTYELLRPVMWKDISGGDTMIHQAQGWKWEGAMVTPDQPWAISTS